ncbi:Enoyl-[acyl-carrier-protein] reductase [NADH] [Caminicella sporogenes DSM 14501]|uniref:Enoyl-[acyl-carrier-protein] reductase [NADH] n=1 Tax=Caminicella sporogenes DSM 14501 TaxID=1121266 RepID=A0A1M6MH20_9FIRM|nr:enoyl-ACP reductase FabI [Caminicella sporogenes]RKD27552.1 enoyl-ACP reductase [Caminicella sporogenes]SHJ82779.1 Enoyl-[acyl-carrier-protein] reductase [NADH] [Caminicella sporogenes DSM 14501]
MGNLLKDKNILIMGVANKWSIAWGIAQKFHKEGANLAFTYYGDKSKESLLKLLEEEGIDNHLLISCDVTKDEDIENAFLNLKEKFGVLHGVVHSIAHAKKEELQGNYYNTSREGYHMAQDISAYSLVAVARNAKPLMTEGGSIVTLTYLGSERAVKNYNVMGVAKAALEASVRYLAVDLGPENITVNSISAGPIKTLAAKGVKGFNQMLKEFENVSPMKRTVKTEEIANTALFLCSDLGTGITGENIHVDCGYHILG